MRRIEEERKTEVSKTIVGVVTEAQTQKQIKTNQNHPDATKLIVDTLIRGSLTRICTWN